ncbi:MAG: PKD domain-containing protein, partial [Gemmatimonadota bacterium]|nr:PKD domain-containing protein [Gemmatimonadota bacterium]
MATSFLSRRLLVRFVAVLAVLLFGFSCTEQPTAPPLTIDAPPGTPSSAVMTEPVVLVGAGNIARCEYTNDDRTAALLDEMPTAAVFTTGDNIYGGGSLSDYQTCYGPNWGRHISRTRPAPGETDYATAGAAGYFAYFGAAAGAAGEGYYSYDMGSWHVVVLNSNVAMTAGSAQETWLRGDLASTTKACILAYWHHPRFSSYSTSVRGEVKPLWDALHAAGADVVVNGHYRLYERFAPQTPEGAADPENGIRQFTVGTGGHGISSFGTPRPNSEVRISGAYGVLKLTLDATSYSWQFVPVAGETANDAGTGVCHGADEPPTPNEPPTANAGGPYQADNAVTFDGSGSDDPDGDEQALEYAWNFGDGTTGTGVSPTKVYAADGVFTATLVVTDALGAPSAPASATVTI